MSLSSSSGTPPPPSMAGKPEPHPSSGPSSGGGSCSPLLGKRSHGAVHEAAQTPPSKKIAGATVHRFMRGKFYKTAGQQQYLLLFVRPTVRGGGLFYFYDNREGGGVFLEFNVSRERGYETVRCYGEVYSSGDPTWITGGSPIINTCKKLGIKGYSEKRMVEELLKSQMSSEEVAAATHIQKVWRGYSDPKKRFVSAHLRGLFRSVPHSVVLEMAKLLSFLNKEKLECLFEEEDEYCVRVDEIDMSDADNTAILNDILTQFRGNLTWYPDAPVCDDLYNAAYRLVRQNKHSPAKTIEDCKGWIFRALSQVETPYEEQTMELEEFAERIHTAKSVASALKALDDACLYLVAAIVMAYEANKKKRN